MPTFHPLAWAILGIDFLIRMGLGVRVIMRRAQVPVSLAWLSLLLFAPLVGIFAYALVGEVRIGRRRVKRFEALTRGIEERAALFWRGGAQDWTSDCEPYRHIAYLARNVGGMPPLRGNALQLVGEWEPFIKALVDDIDRARHHCHLLYYIWMDHGAGLTVGEALIRAAQRGVACRVMADGAGSRRFVSSGITRRMRAAGVTVIESLPVNPFRALLARVDVRNHRKIAVFDGWVAYVGSHNITDATFGLDPRRLVGPWVDATMRIEGPAAQALEVVFLRDWQLELEGPPERLESLLPEPEIPAEGSIVQIVPTGPGHSPAAMHDTLLTAIYAARRELILTTPYFVPDEATKSALTAAALHGVDVTLVMPERNDSRMVAAASRSHYLDLLEAGVRIMHHQRGLLHSKTLTIDSDVALIGSANIDMRSFYLNFEASALVYDTDFASLVRLMQKEYIQESVEIFADEWRRRPFRKRLIENTAKLLGPLL